MNKPGPNAKLPLAAARRVDGVCSRFEAAWKAARKGGAVPRMRITWGRFRTRNGSRS